MQPRPWGQMGLGLCVCVFADDFYFLLYIYLFLTRGYLLYIVVLVSAIQYRVSRSVVSDSMIP